MRALSVGWRSGVPTAVLHSAAALPTRRILRNWGGEQGGKCDIGAHRASMLPWVRWQLEV